MDTASEFLVSAWSGVVGNTLFLAGLVLVGFLLRYLPMRRRLRRLFLKRKRQPVYVLLSHIRVAQNGAIGASGGIYSFASSTIALKEAQVAQQFKGAFLSPVPGLAGQPGLLSSLLINEFAVEISPSPLVASGAPMDGTIIAVGGPAFNSVSAWIEQNLSPSARIQPGGSGIVFSSGATSIDPAVGFISKSLDTANDRFVFYVAGPSEEATAAALLFLLESWQELERRYRNRSSFAIAVRVVSVQPLRAKVEFYGP